MSFKKEEAQDTESLKNNLEQTSIQLESLEDQNLQLEFERKQLKRQVQVLESEISELGRKTQANQKQPKIPEVENLRHSIKGKDKVIKEMKSQLVNKEALNGMYIDDINRLNSEVRKLKKERMKTVQFVEQVSHDPGENIVNNDSTKSDFSQFVENLNSCYSEMQHSDNVGY